VNLHHPLRTWIIAVSAVTLLVPHNASAYRTATDGPLLNGKGRVAWADPHMGFVVNSANIPAGLSVTDVAQALSQARAAWSNVDCARADPSYSGSSSAPAEPKDGVNTISWVNDWAAHGFPSDSAGSTDVQYSNSDGNWHIAEADIYLNLEQRWSSSGTTDVQDLRAVLTHELGHALGLLHSCEPNGSKGAPRCSSSFTDDTMYPLYELGASTLGGDDAAGICYLYPVNGACDTCAPDEACVNDQCVAQCEGEPCQAGEICGIWGCTPPGGCLVQDCTGATCLDDSQCGPLNSCADGRCERGSSMLSQTCASSSDCDDGVCVNARCSPECSSGTDCATGSCVSASEWRLAGCYETGEGAFGAVCLHGDECASGLCVSRSGAGTCTIRCEPGVCPQGTQCDLVDGQRVCESSILHADGGGCAVASGRSGNGLLLGFLSLLTGVAVRRRKKRYS
jgi:hypothetical protein